MFKSVLFMSVATASAALVADAQRPIRTILEQIDIRQAPTTTIVAKIAPGMTVERHIHPGTEMTYVIEGGGDMFVEGKPTMHVKAGDHWQVAAGTPRMTWANSPSASVRPTLSILCPRCSRRSTMANRTARWSSRASRDVTNDNHRDH